jgi:RNA polymerase sigma factor (sigma-70 family)
MTDHQLLQEYLEHNSESAFRELVERYLGLVRGTALRQVRDPSMAEDIAQTVFILLARKAGQLRRAVILAGWLHRTTRFVASRALRSSLRRQRREQESLQMQPQPTAETDPHHLAPLLDDALTRLGESDRNTLLLRYAQQESMHSLGHHLGISEEAAKKRVARALDRLRRLFASRGIILPASALAGVLSQQLAQSAAPALAASIAARSLASTTSSTAALPPLARDTLNALAWTKAKMSAAIGLASLAVIGLTVALWPPSSTERVLSSPRAEPAPITSAKPETGTPEPAQLIADSPATPPPQDRVLRLQVLSRLNGEPVPFARLAVNQVTAPDGNWVQRYDLVTDESGGVDVPYPSNTTRLDVGVVSSGWVARSVRWNPFRDDPIPTDYVLHLDPTTTAMGGWVRNSHGQPVPNAAIWIQLGSHGDVSGREPPREAVGFLMNAPLAQTDAQGSWTAAVLPSDPDTPFQLHVRHPQFAERSLVSINRDHETQSSLDALWAGRWISTLKPALTLSGIVTGPDSLPVANADVVHSPFSNEAIETQTDAAGGFLIPGLDEGSFEFVVTAHGYAPEYRQVNLHADLPPVEVQLKPGATLRVQLLDATGSPVPNATLGLEQWSNHRHVLKWSATSDPLGIVEWNSAPPRDNLELCAVKPGWCYTRNVNLQADGQLHLITLRRSLELAGRVTDATTGLAVDHLRAFPGYGIDAWERSETRHGDAGLYRVVFAENQLPWRLRIEAPGYAPFVSDPIAPDGPGWLDVSLQPSVQHGAPHGLVLQPDGTPAARAHVALLAPGRTLRLYDARFILHGGDPIITTTHPDGRFDLPPVPNAHTLVAANETGFARQPLSGLSAPLTLQLQPWGRVEITVEPSLVDSCHQASLVGADHDPSPPPIEFMHLRNRPPYERETRFRFLRVPPGSYVLHFTAGDNQPAHHHTQITVRPGDTTAVHIRADIPDLL